jgi:hypothetical protein
VNGSPVTPLVSRVSNSSVGRRAEVRGSTQAKRAHFILSFKVTDCLSTVAGVVTKFLQSAGVDQTANLIQTEIVFRVIFVP